MAIEVNGVSLPDIPEDVLAQYPYASIFVSRDANDIDDLYVLMVSGSAHIHIDKSLLGSSNNAIVSYAPGVQYISALSDGEMCDWMLFKQVPESDVIGFVEEIPNTDGAYIILVWANHDIYEASSVDADNMTFITDGSIYFSDSAIAFEEEYSAPSTWFESLSTQVRKLSGVAKRYKPDEMIEALTNIQNAEGVEF